MALIDFIFRYSNYLDTSIKYKLHEKKNAEYVAGILKKKKD